MTAYLQSHKLLPEMQSAYRKGHLTETVVLRVSSHLVDAIDKGKFALLSQLDLSAALDMVDYVILLEQLSNSFGIRHGIEMVPVISQRLNSVCSLSSCINFTLTYGVQSSSEFGLRADFIHSLHGRQRQPYIEFWIVSSLLCKRYPTVRLTFQTTERPWEIKRCDVEMLSRRMVRGLKSPDV